mmetsp:Transcript_26298/g.49956  ORF Transcript_26298/g.49956 Transcript_26298/m.49956 type:complete len:671 (+) Transcript_26298:129-2141(+)
MPDDEENYDDEEFEDYDDDDFEEDEEEEAPAPSPPPRAVDPEPARAPTPPKPTSGLPPTAAGERRASVMKPTEEDAVAMAIAMENERSKLASRESLRRSSLTGVAHDPRPASRGGGSSYKGSSGSLPAEETLPERRSVGLPSKENLVRSQTDEEMVAARARVHRWREVNKLVKLKEVAIDDIFSLAPLTLRELSDLGRGPYQNQFVKGSQTNDDARTIDIQTEEIDERKVAVQCPEDLGLSREVLEKQADASKRRHKALPGWTSTAGALQGDNTRRLNKFLGHYGPIVESLLNERTKKETTIFSKAPPAANNPMSSHAMTLAAEALLKGRRAQCSSFSCDARVQLLAAAYTPAVHGPAALQEHGEAGRGCVAVWDLTKPETPTHVLSSEGTPTCCCWSPNQPFCVIAGMEEGGVCLWDLREPADGHPEAEGVVRRRPTYTTEFACDFEDIVGSIAALAVSSSKPTSAASVEGARGMSFQLVTLDSWSNVVVWLVTEMSNSDIAGADVDFGLRIGGRVKMLRTNVVASYGPSHAVPLVLPAAGSNTDAPSMKDAIIGGSSGRVRGTFDLAVFPAAQNEFLVAGDQGVVLRGTRFGVTPVPRQYSLSDPALGSRFAGRYLSRCSSMHFSPFFANFFLAAYSPATVALYTVTARCSKQAGTPFRLHVIHFFQT